MKKRIIAALLVVVMTVLALASCGVNLAKDDLSEYIEGEFDVNAFMTAIRSIDIKDGEYTTDKATNAAIVESDIYGPIASGVITGAGTYEGDKLTDGNISATDVVYYCYYITYAGEDGVTHYYKRSEMLESAITATSTKAKHVINLGDYFNKDDGFKKLLAEKLLEKQDVKYYSMMDASAVKTDLGADALVVKNNYLIAVSYTVKTTTVDGEGTSSTVTEKTSYELMDMSDATDELAVALNAALADTDNVNVVKIGEKVSVKASDWTAQNKKMTGEIKIGDKTYSDITVNYMVDKNLAAEEEITFTYTDSSLVSVAIDDLVNTNGTTTTDLSKKEVTFHILPVYRLAVPANTTESILEYVYGKKISDFANGTTTTGFGYSSSVLTALNKVLNDEGYKCADDKAVSHYITAVKDLLAGTYSAYTEINDLETARKNANTAVEEAIKAKETATDKAAAEKVIVEKEKDLKAAEKALDDAVRAKVREELAKIAAAKKGETVLGTEFMKTIREEIDHSRKDAYDKYITETIAEEIYKIIDSQIKVVSWPEKLVKEFYKNIYDEYEYNFYNGNYTPEGATTATQSNYLQYNGDFNAFLKAQTKATDDEGIEKAITKQAQDYITPLIKLYVVAQALDEYDFGGKSADDLLSDYVAKDIEIGTSDFKAYNYYSTYFNNYYFADENLTEKENAKQEKKADKNVEKSIKNAKKASEDFLMDNAAFRVYKKQLGRKNYRAWEQSYGEINIRASLQLNKLMYLLTSTNKTIEVDAEEEHIHTSVNYVERDGKLYHDYRLITYKVH